MNGFQPTAGVVGIDDIVDNAQSRVDEVEGCADECVGTVDGTISTVGTVAFWCRPVGAEVDEEGTQVRPRRSDFCGATAVVSVIRVELVKADGKGRGFAGDDLRRGVRPGAEKRMGFLRDGHSAIVPQHQVISWEHRPSTLGA